MPFALVLIGLILIVTGAKNTYVPFGKQVVGDFTGPNNFLYWLVAIGVVGALGYIPSIRKLSHAFLALIVISLVLHNGGLFQKIQQFLKSGPTSTTPAPATSATSPTASLQTITQIAEIAAA